MKTLHTAMAGAILAFAALHPCAAARAAGSSDDAGRLLAQSRAALGGSALDRVKLLELQKNYTNKDFDGAKAEARAAGAAPVADRKGNRWVLGNQGRVHMLMAGHCMVKIESIYGSIFEGILNEKISTKPVEVVTPFPWVQENGKPLKRGGLARDSISRPPHIRQTRCAGAPPEKPGRTCARTRPGSNCRHGSIREQGAHG